MPSYQIIKPEYSQKPFLKLNYQYYMMRMSFEKDLQKMMIGYARVSTQDQNLSLQHENPSQAKFCGQCGKGLNVGNCTACGQKLVPGSKFCGSCGQAV